MKKILIVDDLADNRYILDVLLTTNGYSVVETSNGKEALEYTEKDPPDLIITDILMPILDGFSLCRSLKSDKRFKEIPIIIYTATYTDARDKQLAMEVGADLFMVKPLDPEEILANIQKVFHLTKKKREGEKEVVLEEAQFFREYNEALIRKLEDKMLELQKMNSRIFTLYHLSNFLSQLKSKDESIHEVISGLVEKAGYPNTIFFSGNKEQPILKVKDSCGVPEQWLEVFRSQEVFKLVEAEHIYDSAQKQYKPVKLDDVTTDPNWPIQLPWIRSALIIPVQHNSRVFGILFLSSEKTAEFSDEDEQIISTLANNLAICLMGCESEMQIQDHLQKLTALHKIDTSIASCTNLNLNLTLLLNYARSLLKTDSADIVLINSDTLACSQVISAGFPPEASAVIKENSRIWKTVVEKRGLYSEEINNHTMLADKVTLFLIGEGLKHYWGIPIIAKGKIIGVLELYKKSDYLPDIEWLDFLDTIAGQAAIAIESSENFENLMNTNAKLTQAYDATIAGWSEALDLRDREIAGHTQRVTEMAVRFARRLKLNEAEIMDIRRGATLHDIGKICTPDAILFKTQALTDEEWLVMKKHPETAYTILRKIDYLQKAIEIPYCHHEHWDGTGYPRKLKGTEIPLSARFFAIIDVWDALTSDRLYRKAWSAEKARAFINENTGTQFDPTLVPIFFELLDATTTKKK